MRLPLSQNCLKYCLTDCPFFLDHYRPLEKLPSTIEELVRIIHEGFKVTASHEETHRVEVRLDGVKS